jgi:transcriptional regulator with XRE-family HTH domain
MREAMALTQSQFGRKLGVSKMTVSRWERGKMKPSPATTRAIQQLQRKIRYEGVNIDGEKRPAGRRHPSPPITRRKSSVGDVAQN